MKIINFEEKDMIPLTNKQYESYIDHTNFNICKRSLKINTIMIKKYRKKGPLLLYW